METPTHDIYGTNRSRRHDVELTETDQSEILARPYVEAARRRMVSTLALSSIVVLFIAVIAVVVVRYHIRAVQFPPARWQGRTASASGEPVSLRDVPPDAQTVFLLDELKEQRLLSGAGAGEQALTAPWVKQAAFHLVQAEKADREDRYEDALAQYAQAMRIFPDMKGVQRRLGMLYLKQEDYEKAAEALEKVPIEEELTFGVANNLGVTYMAIHEYGKAEKNLLAAIRLNPSYPLAYFNLATMYTRIGEPRKAALAYERYFKLKPDDVSAAQNYALVLLQLKQWDQAIVLLEDVARKAPEVAPIHFRLAEAYAQTRNNRAAVDSLRRGASLVDARNALVWMSRPEFDPARNEPGFQELLKELGSDRRR